MARQHTALPAPTSEDAVHKDESVSKHVTTRKTEIPEPELTGICRIARSAPTGTR